MSNDSYKIRQYNRYAKLISRLSEHGGPIDLSQAKFDLPVFVYAGLIGSLELQVPWKALWTAPTKVCVEDLVLLVIPKDAAPYR